MRMQWPSSQPQAQVKRWEPFEAVQEEQIRAQLRRQSEVKGSRMSTLSSLGTLVQMVMEVESSPEFIWYCDIWTPLHNSLNRPPSWFSFPGLLVAHESHYLLQDGSQILTAASSYFPYG
ncbi:hypothetical protein DFH06DRAFT_1125146 [Mycena polygramma]|nr:hypothetical protein DFH06DRAFT_1125146 [Mycena polygramma]